MDKIYESNKDLLRTDFPDFRSGDTVSLGMKITEGSRTRIQIFEGVVIGISSGGGINKTFTIRKISNGV
jgi:large subunit ribosomal protein L19